MIANKIDSKRQEEIEAMMEITCEIHGIEMSWMLPVVSNLYAAISKINTVGHKVSSQYSEAEAR
jgi:hypothetical protein